MTVALRHEQADEGWRALTRQLVATGRRHGASLEDAEDRAQDAMLRLVRDDRAAVAAPPIQNAYRALQLANADASRKQSRKLEIPSRKQVSVDDPAAAVAIPDAHGDAEETERRLAFLETTNAVKAIVGEDALEQLIKLAAGWTDAEIDAERRPEQPSAGALRKRVFRAIPQLTDRLNRL